MKSSTKKQIHTFFTLSFIIAGLGLFAPSTHAAVGVDATATSSTWSTNITTVAWDHTVASSRNGILAVACSVQENTDASREISTLADTNGLSFSLVGLMDDTTANDNMRVEIWYAKNTSYTGSTTIRATFAGDVDSGNCGSISLTDVDQLDPIGSTASTSGASASPSLAVTSVTAGGLVVDALSYDGTKTSISVGAGQTHIFKSIALQSKGASHEASAGGGTVTMSWSVNASTDYVLSAVSFNPGTSLSLLRYRWRANQLGETGTTWLAAEDSPLTGENNLTASTTRLRILVDEVGSIATTTLYQLEYATSTSAGCSALTYVVVADQASSTGYAWKMSPTAQFANAAASTDNAGLTNPTGVFRAGTTQDTAARLSSGIAHAAGEFTELEFSIEASTLSYVSGQSYCFRVTNADDTTNLHSTVYPKINLATTTELEQLHYRWRADNGLEGIFGGNGATTTDPTAGTDNPDGIAVDANYIYVVGSQGGNGAGDPCGTGSLCWHVAKFDITTGEAVTAFGGNGSTTTDPTIGADYTWAVAKDANAIYVAGKQTGSGAGEQCGAGVDDCWRIGKFDITTGEAVTAFGGNGATSTNPTTGSDFLYDIAVDANYIYVAGSQGGSGAGDPCGTGGSCWHVAKFDITTGEAVTAFGGNGSTTTDPTTGGDVSNAIAVDANYIYVAGYQTGSGAGDACGTGGTCWRIAKFDITTGEAVTAFGTNGATTTDPTTGGDNPAGIAVDANYIYVAGEQVGSGAGDPCGAGSTCWRVAKFDINTGEVPSDDASFLAAEDTVLEGAVESGVTTASTTRLRILIDETDGGATTTLYQLEYATSTVGSVCAGASTWVPVADQASTTAFAWKMSPTAQFANAAASTDNTGLTNPTGVFRAGTTQDTAARLSGGIAHAADEFTELEFSIEASDLSYVDGQSYCFRVTNADDTTDFTYTKYPKINLASTTALSQLHYRWRANNGGEGAGGSDWWDADFKNRRKITLNNAPSSENLHDFPVPIILEQDAFDDTFGTGVDTIDYTKTLNHAFDVRFVNASSTLMLKHEVEEWNETGTSTVWVKLPFLEAATTSQYIWMYYNNAATTTSGSATTSVWDANFVGVWHLGATTTLGAKKFIDSTSNDRTGILTNTDYSISTSTLDGGIDFDGSDDYLTVGTGPTNVQTVSAWVNPEITEGYFVDLNTTAYVWSNAGTLTATGFTTPTNYVNGVVASGISASIWQHITVTTGTALNASILEIGRATSTAYTQGIIDEVRLSNIARSAEWIQQEYRFDAASSTTHTFGTEDTVGASWLAAEDTVLEGAVESGVTTASTTRLRILIDETGGGATTTLYQLEYATSTVGSVCAGASAWVPVADQASTTAFAWKMSPTAQFANGGATTNIADPNGLTDTTGSFRAGVTQDTAARLSSGIAHAADEFTELEFSIEASDLSYVDGQSYCFRVTNADDTTNITYTVYPRISIATSTVAFTQNTFRLYKDNNSLNPTTVWDGLLENAPMTSANERVGGGDVVRIRTNVTVSSTLSGSSQAFAIEYAELTSGACSGITSWKSVGAKGGGEVFRLANTSQGDSTTITTTLLSDSNVGELLSELNPSITNPNSATASQKIEYDWPVQYATARFSSATICFRMTKDDGTAFTTYSNYPQILTNVVGAGSDTTIGAPTGGGAQGAATTTGGTAPGSGESGGTPPPGGNQGGGGAGGGGEAWILFFKFYASILTGTVEFVTKFINWRMGY